ncbi:DUF2807 domain-containing protein [Polaribacter aestuariivivens]|uniref:DUF2807 domain-containing protein n=1 Tax=Polaribacter aestuariivivens TaxID=2304626 RepID=A0A5S3N122_9FLAO|nr:head GIN domain-containing protein [Polaribacter aestuariivivens]TMM29008.1 DUF2807 domain-containing protein [Polaribacter aestuariivivens]
MKKSINKIVAILFVATIFTSCGIDMLNRVNGNRNVTTEDRKVADNFSGIRVSSGIDLYITQGNINKVTVEADENLQEIIITEVIDGVLKIYTDQNIWQAKSRKVHVTIQNLNSLKATSGSDVYGNGIIKTQEISISATSGADIRLEVDAESVETSSTSGSDIRISGIATNHASSATSGSSIDAYDLKSENVIAKATSGAGINIYASQKIEARATSGGDIDYKGSPKNVSKKSSSGGSVSKK